MKKAIIFITILFCVMITACSKDDEATPQDRFDTYVDQWNEQNFTEMYDQLSAESTETYPTDQFIDRYKKIYEDLDVSDLQIAYEKLDEEALDKAMEEGTATFPFSVEMETVAGPIAFDYEATLVREGEEEEDLDWFVAWDPGFIFPEIKDGGEISFKSESPVRGEIFDRNNMPLAINDSINEIGIVPEKLGENTDAAKNKIADLLNMDVDSIDAKLNQGWVEPNLYVPIKKMPGMSNELIDQLSKVDGVSIDEVTGRVYPLNEAAAHLVGYIGQIQAEDLEELEEKYPGKYASTDMIGRRGLEQLYEQQLKGEKGLKIIVSNEGEDDVVLAEKPVKDGDNITVTIDANIQEKLYESYEDDAGTASAIEPKTGETLALVSSPAFNPNDILYGISASEWDKLQDNPDKPLINRFAATFAPGSAIKPITSAIGLANGSIDPDEGVEINGKEWSNGESWGNYTVKRVSSTDEPVDLLDALTRSDNIYFAMKAVEMGGDAFVSGLKQFGFDDDFPFEYPMETSTVSSSGALDEEVLLANAGYGQGELQMSALHLAVGYTPFLNEGKMIKPTLLDSEETGQIWQEELITSDQATIIQDALRDVVASPKGTAKKAQEADFPISGKTGTAELKRSGEESGQENGWFVGYPTDDQDILIAMMIERTEDVGGSSYTVGKVTDVLQEIK